MSLCNTQNDFNKAFHDAIKYTRDKDEEETRKNKNFRIAFISYLIIHMIFLIWGVLLAFKAPQENRVIHITLAIVFSPIYVIAYYFNLF